MEFAEITSGLNFRNVPKVGSVQANPLASHLVNLILKKRFRMAAEDLADFSAHVLRPGFRTQAGRDGVSPLDHAPIGSQIDPAGSQLLR
jgi:hypothetical protein